MAEPAISLRGLRRVFVEGSARHVVLDDVSLDISRGEFVAIRGRSGSGKSTLLNVICGIDQPDGGQVTVSGVDLTGLTERERTLFRRRHIGFVYQAFNLLPTLTVADNVRLVLELNGAGSRDARARTQELLAAVGLANQGGRFPDTLSGGEQQRVAVARALCHEPSVVLADEPTGNLDDASAEVVLGLLDGLLRQRRGTLLVATHSARVTEFCDRVLELHDGHLAPAGPRERRA